MVPRRLRKNHFGLAVLLDTRVMKNSHVRSLSGEKGQEKYSQNSLPSFCG